MNTNEPYSTSPLRVLLVEDNNDYAFSVIQGMAKYFLIEHADTEAKALRKMYIENYDVLLLDLTLDTGYLGGFRFLEYIERLDRFKNLVVIGLSGMSLDDILADKSFDKLAAFVTKPVAPEKLVGIIEQAILKQKGTVAPDEEREEAELE
jgi:DNA-binding NtrC family response regulator